MSHASVDPSLLSTFGGFLEHEEDFLLSDSETVASLFDNEPFSSAASNVSSDFTCPTDTSSPREAFTPGCSSSPQPEKEKESGADKKTEPAAKPVKKRKSWGQELPTPTTNLPPRKRAKTEEEKEQRRVERVLRNRAAAQSSRERKRKEVQALEEEKTRLAENNADMRALLVAKEEDNRALRRMVEEMKQYMRARDPNSDFLVAEPTVKEEENPFMEEENPFIFLQSSEAAPITTLDPVNLYLCIPQVSG